MLQKIQQFMYGRYGGDKLSIVILIAGFILSAIGSFFHPLVFIAYVFYIYAVFRAFSKNIPARRKELALFLKFWKPVESRFSITKRKFKDRNTYKYFRCPSCKLNLRAPRGSGNIVVTCQKCHKEFNTRV